MKSTERRTSSFDIFHANLAFGSMFGCGAAAAVDNRLLADLAPARSVVRVIPVVAFVSMRCRTEIGENSDLGYWVVSSSMVEW